MSAKGRPSGISHSQCRAHPLQCQLLLRYLAVSVTCYTWTDGLRTDTVTHGDAWGEMWAGPFLIIATKRVLEGLWSWLCVLVTTLSAPGDSPGQAPTCYQCSHHAAPLLRGTKASPAGYAGQEKRWREWLPTLSSWQLLQCHTKAPDCFIIPGSTKVNFNYTRCYTLITALINKQTQHVWKKQGENGL